MGCNGAGIRAGALLLVQLGVSKTSGTEIGVKQKSPQNVNRFYLCTLCVEGTWAGRGLDEGWMGGGPGRSETLENRRSTGMT